MKLVKVAVNPAPALLDVLDSTPHDVHVEVTPAATTANPTSDGLSADHGVPASSAEDMPAAMTSIHDKLKVLFSSVFFATLVCLPLFAAVPGV